MELIIESKLLIFSSYHTESSGWPSSSPAKKETPWWNVFLVIFIEPKFDHAITMHCFALFPESLSLSVLVVGLDWCDPGGWRFTQPLLASPTVDSFDSHVVDIKAKQKPCCWCRNKTRQYCWCWNKTRQYCWCRNKTKATLLMLEQNKSHIVDKT